MEENENIVEEKEIKENNEDEVVEDKPLKVNKKVPYLTIFLAVVVVVLSILLIKDKCQSNSYNLKDIYPSYFAEKEGSVKLPKNWLTDNQGNLFYNDKGILTVKGIIMAYDISEDEYNEFIENSADYVELEKMDDYKYVAYKGSYSEESTSAAYTFAYIYNNNQLMQILLVDATDTEFNSILNSLSF